MSSSGALWASGRRRACLVCGFGRYLEAAHLVPARLVGRADATLGNLVWLCPNHHRIYDLGLLNTEERAFLEPRLIALTHRYNENLEALRYLYFQLGLHEVPPTVMAQTRARWTRAADHSRTRWIAVPA